MHEARAPCIGEEHRAADADGRIVGAPDDDRRKGESFERHRCEARHRARRARAVIDVGRRDEERAADQEIGPALGKMRDQRAGEAVSRRAVRQVMRSTACGDPSKPGLEVGGVPVVLRDKACHRRGLRCQRGLPMSRPRSAQPRQQAASCMVAPPGGACVVASTALAATDWEGYRADISSVEAIERVAEARRRGQQILY